MTLEDEETAADRAEETEILCQIIWEEEETIPTHGAEEEEEAETTITTTATWTCQIFKRSASIREEINKIKVQT